MGSSLKSKLRAISLNPNVVSSDRKVSPGLLRLRHVHSIEAGDLELPGDGLRRIGWSGRRFEINKCLFLDTETTGLSGGAGTVAFLVGVGYIVGRQLVIEQLLMRDYADEPALIAALADIMDAFHSVCTFNGRTFDMPLLESRFTMCRLHDRWPDLENLDLLPPSRRTWKLRLESCRLSHLEENILGIHRDGDLPGSEVPARYFQFLKSGDESLLKEILEHNEQDIATLLALLRRLCSIYHDPGSVQNVMDHYSVGRALEKQGELVEAREVYECTAVPQRQGSLSSQTSREIEALSNWRLYLIERRNRNYEAMKSVLERMRLRRQMPFEVAVESSKLYEHHYRKLAKAEAFAREAREYCPENRTEDLEKRIHRLQLKREREERR